MTNLIVTISQVISFALDIVVLFSISILAGAILYIQSRKIIKEIYYLTTGRKLSISLMDFGWECAIFSLILIVVRIYFYFVTRYVFVAI